MTGAGGERRAPFRGRLLRGVAALALGASVQSCGDAEPLLFPPPLEMEITRVPSEEGRVGDPVERAPQVLVRDAAGLPRPALRVRFVVTEGGGSVTPEETVTDERGIANASRWVLGTRPGLQELQVLVEGLEPLVFQAAAVAGPPSVIQVAHRFDDSEPVGSELDERVTVEFKDRFDNPVPGVPVSAQVIEGEGMLEVASVLSGEDGRWVLDRWTLGPTPGEQRIRVTWGIGSPPSRVFAVQTVPAAPASVAVIRGDAQVALPGAEVSTPPAVRVEDRFRNRVPGFPVAFQVAEGGGAVTGANTVTDSAGVAYLGGWRLGPQPGPNRLTVTVAGVEPVSVLAEGASEAARVLSLAAPLPQESPAGYPVPGPPAIRVTDGTGAPLEGVLVTFQVTEGGGTVSPASTLTDAEGLARVQEWRLGNAAGENRLLAQVQGAAGLALGVTGKVVLVVRVDRVVLNQGNQDPAGSIPAVAGRAGVLRAMGRATLPNTVMPDARITVFRGDTPVLSRTVSLTAPGIPLAPDGQDPNVTWNLPLPAELVGPGLGVRVEVDPDGALDVPDRDELVFPAPGGIHRPEVRELPVFRTTFIPVNATQINTTGNVTSANVDQFMEFTLRVFPVGQADVAVRQTFITNEGPLSGSDASQGWGRILNQIQQIRVLEAPDRYYHGILNRPSGTSLAGLAYVPGSPDSPFRSALSYDALPGASQTVAHEFGHNFGRRHAPCGNPANPDGSYPYDGALLGHPGWDFATTSFRRPDENRDLMSYCSPRWISDYTYRGVLAFRSASPMGVSALEAAEPRYGILLWGEWSRSGAVLNPAFRAEARPTPAPRRADAEVVGLDGAGRVLFRVPVEGVPLDHADDPTLRHFSRFVPLSPETEAALHELVLVAPSGEDRLRGAGVPPQAPSGLGPAGVPLRADAPRALSSAGPPAIRLSAPVGGPSARVLTWDGDRYPLALVRDDTGTIVAMARGGRIELPAGLAGSYRVQVSDGVHVRVETVR